MLFTAVTVTVPVLAFVIFAMVRVLLPLSAKSPATAPVPGAAETVTVISSVNPSKAMPSGWVRVAVIVDELPAPLSLTDVGVSTRFTVGATSSSSIVSV